MSNTRAFIQVFLLALTILFLFVGVLFKIQHWPGATLLILVGLLVTVAFFIVTIFSKIKSKKEGPELSDETVIDDI